MKLASKKCKPCRGGIPPLTASEAETFLREIPLWTLIDNGSKIKRDFRFKDFISALNFVLKMGELAEREDHHPDISFGWGYCNVTFYTHKIMGLHENDFVMAAKVDLLFQESTGRRDTF